MAIMLLTSANHPGGPIARYGICFTAVPGEAADYLYMGHPQRIHTYDDELHDRRRQLAIVRPPIDFEAERLKRMVERLRDTRDP
jgi:hypothetical protein